MARYSYDWHPSETPPPVEEEPIPVWIVLRGGVIVAGLYYRCDEFIPQELAEWRELSSMAKVDAQYWMVRQVGDKTPDPPL